MQNRLVKYLQIKTHILLHYYRQKQNPINAEVEGSQYFYKFDLTSKVYKNGKYLVTRLSNYDAYNDEIVISDEKNEKFFMTKNEELTTVIGADKFVYFSLLGYFMVLNEGEVLLLKKPIKKFVEATPAKTGYRHRQQGSLHR